MSKVAYPTRTIALDDLLNDLENSRHQPLDSQAEVIAWFLSKTDKNIEKTKELAKSICEDGGLSPIDGILVIPAGKNKYTVIEGNRRICALKLLNRPPLAGAHEDFFRNLNKTHKAAIPSTVTAVVVPDRDTGWWMIERRHEPDQGGAGLIRWDTYQAARAKQRRDGHAGRYESSMAMMQYFARENLLGPKTQELLEGDAFNITTLARLLNSRSFQKGMGISWDGSGWAFEIAPAESLKGLTRVMGDLANGDLSVTRVKTKELIDNYVQSLGKDRPDSTKKSKVSISLDTASGVALPRTAMAKTKRRLPSADKQKRLNKPALKVSDRSIRHVYDELLKLDLEDNPIAIALLLRVLIEQSADHHNQIKRLTVPSKGGNSKLKDKLLVAADDLHQNGKLTRDQFKAFERIRNGQGETSDPDYLNRLAHSPSTIVKKKDLLAIWDKTYSSFLSAIWP